MINIGPKALFIYFCRKFANAGTLRRELMMTKPRRAYESILPSVYAKPEKNTNFGWVIFLERKEIAATLVANGQGLIEVKIPSQRLETKPIKTASIIIPLRDPEFLL